MAAIKLRNLVRRPRPSRADLLVLGTRVTLVIIGGLVASLGYSLFQVPYQIAAGGVAGLAIIVNHFTGWPYAAVYLAFNVPLLIIGFRSLGRWQFLSLASIGVGVFAIGTEVFTTRLPAMLDQWPVTDNSLLGVIYAGLVGGLGGGIVYRGGATLGGTAVLARILQLRTGTPLAEIALYTDGAVVALAGLTFGWETALYAFLALILGGMVADYVLEGASRTRTATIITSREKEVVEALTHEVGRGVTAWPVTGAYTGTKRVALLCSVTRPQVVDLRRVVARADPEAFVMIGVTQQVLGSGFVPLRPGRVE
jgi:uncharacterized membrane-anchored protein YitT (DUF2179 family)